jgi:hypothetical protein
LDKPCLRTVFISYQLLLGVVRKYTGYEEKAFTNASKSRFLFVGIKNISNHLKKIYLCKLDGCCKIKHILSKN